MERTSLPFGVLFLFKDILLGQRLKSNDAILHTREDPEIYWSIDPNGESRMGLGLDHTVVPCEGERFLFLECGRHEERKVPKTIIYLC